MGALFGYLERRLGIGEIVTKVGTGKHPPRGTSWAHTLGYAALAVFLVQAVTGVALGFFYVPAADHAYDSIRVLERNVTGGALLRAIHHWGASAMVVLVALHAMRVFFMGAYKRPREFTWLAGLGLLATVIGLSFTGYLLPWDQKAYFATKVGVNIASRTPEIGGTLQHLLYGGNEIGPVTLNRFFALHVLVLPAALVMLLVVHLQQIQRHGITPVGLRVDDPGQPGRAYHPYHTLKEAVVAIAAVAVVFALASKFGASLEAEADAADAAYEPRPDWYFFAPFEFLKLFKGDNEVLGAFWIPAGFASLLVLLPFIDRNPERRLRKRPICLVLGGAIVLGIGALTIRGALDKPGHYRTPPHPLFAPPAIRKGYDLVRHEGCWSCHTQSAAKDDVFGRSDYDAPDFMEVDKDAEDVADVLEDPPEDMPVYDYLSEAQRLAIGRYLESLHEGN